MDTTNMVFVFGSNEGGIHGAGAARYALNYRGARWGTGYGHMTGSTAMGQSFGIPTKDREIKRTLSLETIKIYVDGFLAYAKGRPDLQFQITCIGCGLAGLKHEDIAPMFEGAPENCWFDDLWEPYLPEGTKFWGAF